MASGMSTTAIKMACWLHCSCPDDDDTQKMHRCQIWQFRRAATARCVPRCRTDPSAQALGAAGVQVPFLTAPAHTLHCTLAEGWRWACGGGAHAVGVCCGGSREPGRRDGDGEYGAVGRGLWGGGCREGIVGKAREGGRMRGGRNEGRAQRGAVVRLDAVSRRHRTTPGTCAGS